MQHRHPLFNSIIPSSALSINSLSILSLPYSFSMMAYFLFGFRCSKSLRKVVLPAPKKPVRIVTGRVISLLILVYSLLHTSSSHRQYFKLYRCSVTNSPAGIYLIIGDKGRRCRDSLTITIARNAHDRYKA